MDSGTTYQKLQESTSTDLIVTDFGGRCGQGLVLSTKACDDDMVDVQHFCFFGIGMGLVGSTMFWVVEVKKKLTDSVMRSCLISPRISDLT